MIKSGWPPVLIAAVAMLVAASPALGEQPSEPKPSVLLVVLDTVRADAVSAYGKVDGTTPHFDGLAKQGVRYTHAYSAAPWTLPSHVTLFTGRSIDEHRVSMPGVATLSQEFATLADLMQADGYETAAFSENLTVSDSFGLLRGFETRETTTLNKMNQEDMIDAAATFQRWIRHRDRSRPFFAFVNILDAHRPYSIRTTNPWVPETATPRQIADRHPNPERQICGAVPVPDQLAILRGLYLGDVHAADAKLGKILGAARISVEKGRLITVATSDHGELLGENTLVGHEFSVHENLLRVPLVVSGIDEAAPAVVETPVGLIDVMASIIEWTNSGSHPQAGGIPLPLTNKTDSEPPRSFFAAYTDRFISVPDAWKGRVGQIDKNAIRQFCGESNRVFGGMASLVRYPFKFVWYERYPSSLYDLRWDPEERSDQIRYQRDIAEALGKEIQQRIANSRITEDAGAPLSDEALKALKQLGYIH